MPKDPQYDPEIIRTSARQLQSDARVLEIVYAVSGALLFGSSTFSTFQLLHLLRSFTSRLSLVSLSRSAPQPESVGFGVLFLAALFAALGALAGYRLARMKTAQLRLHAQLALCQVRIEEKLGR